jgi:hypothetical protein
MSLDPRIEEAIKESVKNHNQSENLAQKIIAWLEALVEGNESLEDKDSIARHVNLIYDNTEVSIDSED